MTLTCRFMNSPVGRLKLVANDNRLVAILWENDRPNRVRLGPMTEDPDSEILQRTEQQLNEYFAGTRSCFELELEFSERVAVENDVQGLLF